MKRLIAPATLDDASALLADGVDLLAGGTDVVDRLHQSVAAPDVLVRIARILPREIGVRDDVLHVDAGVTLAELTEHPALAAHAALREACEHTATPQIRSAATVGGALRQKVRCHYFRHPDRNCLRKGGAACLARDGDHGAHAIFDNVSGCIAVHPSTLLCALLAADGRVAWRVDGSDASATADDLVRINPRDPLEDLALPAQAIVTGIEVPIVANAREGYLRASPRALADWPTVEVAARIRVEGDVVVDARITLGAVARTPRRARAAEKALVGARFTLDAIRSAASLAADGATPLEHNGFKVPLVRGAVEALLTRLV